MTDIPTPIEMGFAEFTAKLIAEVFDAVATSQAEQEQRQAEIVAMATLTPEEFAEQYITNEQVDEELAHLFPTNQPKRPHAIFTGAAYNPLQPDSPESPKIEASLGIKLEPRNLKITPKGALLKRSAVIKVKQQTRLRLAQARLSTLRQLVKQGIPHVIVDSGRVNAKLTFQVVRVQDAKKPEVAARLAVPLKSLGNLAQLSLPPTLKNTRLIVRQADDQAPQTSQLQVNIFGEVEITFKTVT